MPPPPPPPGPPPPPSFGNKGPGKVSKSGGGAPDRDQLLNSIRQGAALKKTVTNDRSGPFIEGSKSNNKPAGGPKPFSVPSSSSAGSNSNVSNGAPQLGGLFAGGMPALKPTGRGRMGPVNPPSSGNSNHVKRTPSTEAIPSATTQASWKAKTVNGSTSGSSISSASSVNRGPPPQPPPANRKPSLVPNDSTDNVGISRNPPSIPTKPPTLNFGKQSLAPKPPPLESKPTATSPVPPAGPGMTGRGAPPSKKPSPPPKSPSVVSMTMNWPGPANPTSPPAPPPPSSKPTIVRAQSLRSVKPNPGAQEVDDGSMESLQERRNQSSLDISSPPSAPPPPPNRYATLPRNALANQLGAPRGPLPPVPRPGLPMANGGVPSPGKIRPPTVRPPPPPQRINPPAAIPPPPPSSAPPPPPPHRMSPAPPPPPGPANSRSPNIYNNGGPPTPPTRGSSMRSNGSVTSLSSMVVPPPPPPSLATAFQQQETEDFESRFASRFRPLHHLPTPESFTGCPKIYPTRQLANQSMKRQQAPQPPTMQERPGARWPSSNAAPC